jgi:nitric oxide reductase NorD protein
MPSSRPEAQAGRERGTLQLFYRALSGRASVLATEDDIASRRQLDTPDTLRLPDGQDRTWYRLALAHKAVHEDAGTDIFQLSRLGTIFPGARAALRLAPRRPGESDLQLVMRSLPDTRLAIACFLVMEELRVDELLARQYPGLAPDLRAAQAAELSARPALSELGECGRLVEVLIRASLGWRRPAPAGALPGPAGAELLDIARRLSSGTAAVEDAVDAAIRAHDVIMTMVSPGPGQQWSMAPVRYRDALDAQFVDVDWDAAAGPLVDAEADAEVRVHKAKPVELSQRTRAAPNPAVDPGTPEPKQINPDAARGEPVLSQDDEDLSEVDAYLYPEWDYRADAYRPRWCRVREFVAAPGQVSETYQRTLRERHELMKEIRRQFERIAPETLRRVRGVTEGDDLDLDACIDAFADLRAGIPPSDNLYITRDRTQRDVAVVFLIDLSYSTRQYVSREGRSYKPIFEIEREALILLMEPLAKVGDVFGMYGFSGDGRRDVRIVVIKDIKEPLGAQVIGRLDSLQPIHSTRMGAAIRHSTTKLRGQQVGTHLLIIISDGRPSDVDYGQEYGNGAEIEYSVRDTRAALEEARAQGVRPFLLTVDANGSDYLRQMCDGFDYEVLDEVSQLPERLVALYGQLTDRGRARQSAATRPAKPELRPQLWLSRPAVG